MVESVIIVAGGKGLRMGHDLPKQFIAIEGKPVLMRTIEVFYRYNPSIHIVVVLPEAYREYWKSTCEEYNFTISHCIVNGGETRFHSVKNGLEKVEGGMVAVHDAARPFASTVLIKRVFDAAHKFHAAIPVVPATDSLRQLTKEGSKIIDRSTIKMVQTPQVFKTELLKEAYRQPYTDVFTDDASVVEAYGEQIHLVDGESTNIKITTPFDMEIAKSIINLQKEG